MFPCFILKKILLRYIWIDCRVVFSWLVDSGACGGENWRKGWFPLVSAAASAVQSARLSNCPAGAETRGGCWWATTWWPAICIAHWLRLFSFFLQLDRHYKRNGRTYIHEREWAHFSNAGRNKSPSQLVHFFSAAQTTSLRAFASKSTFAHAESNYFTGMNPTPKLRWIVFAK